LPVTLWKKDFPTDRMTSLIGTRGTNSLERPALPTSDPLAQSSDPARTERTAAWTGLAHASSHSIPRIAVYRDGDSPPLVISLETPAAIAAAGKRAADDGLTQGDPQEGDRHSPDAGRVGRKARQPSDPAQSGSDPRNPPGIDSSHPGSAHDAIPRLIDHLTEQAYSLAHEQGGSIPLPVFRELVENLVHASFAGVVVTILDRGNTVRISDHGPGIPDKKAALRPGFTSADSLVKEYIRGVGSGFSVVQRTLAALGGTLDIEDNLGRGTVVTARIPAPPQTSLAPASAPAYNLPERQLKVLLLTVELAPVGPTRIARELGVSTSTAYRDLVSLEEAGFVACRPSGHRSVTDAGLVYLGSVL